MKLLDRRFFNFSLSVQGFATQPAANPTAGTQYIVADNPTGAFASASQNQIARYDGENWSFFTPKEGDLEVLNLSTGEFLQFDGSHWNVVASLSNSNPDSSSGSHPISIVDDIIYGYDDGDNHRLSPATLSELRGRPFLTTGSGYFYLAVDNILASGNLSGNVTLDERYNSQAVYAGFADAKIHSLADIQESELQYSSTDILDGDFIFNKADNSLYCYDADHSRFIKLGGHRSYVVDALVDYVGSSLPASFNSGDALLYEVADTSQSGKYFRFFQNGQEKYAFEAPAAFSFANINSILSDDPAIYSVYQQESGNEYSALRITHDLYDGDAIFNKADGYTYIFSVSGNSKSFVRSTSAFCPPILDILHIGFSLPESPDNDNDKYIQLVSNGPSVYFNSPDGSGGWNSEEINDNNLYGRYASLDNFKIYYFFPVPHDKPGFLLSDIPIGVPFLNNADNSLYIFDGTAFIKSGSNSSSDSPFTSLNIATEAHSLSAAEVTAKGFSLAHNIANGQEGNTLLFVSGIAQTVGVDFSASGNSISWDNKALDSIPLAAGDDFLIQYVKE